MDKSSPKRPNRSIVVGQKMVVNTKILGDFQTMCMRKGASADDNL